MNKLCIKIAVAEAEKFLVRAKIVLDQNDESSGDTDWLFGSKYTGALKRQSIDLTRSLAEMRKP